MLRFLKKLYEHRLKDITIIMLDDSKPGEDNSYTIKPNRLFVLFGFGCVSLSFFIISVFVFTPLGGLLYTKEDAQMRQQVEDITMKVLTLQDSLEVRDVQLQQMKNIIRLSVDTTMSMDDRFVSMLKLGEPVDRSFSMDDISQSQFGLVEPSGIVFSNILESAPDFPASYPVDGIVSQNYAPETYHFGIDIATSDHSDISAIADGTVVNASWTMSEGFVITLQHAGGMLSIYKHCSALTKRSGDNVLKGDIIGTTGNVGVTSSAPHLHFEIWKDGLPQDPAMYLIQ